MKKEDFDASEPEASNCAWTRPPSVTLDPARALKSCADRGSATLPKARDTPNPSHAAARPGTGIRWMVGDFLI